VKPHPYEQPTPVAVTLPVDVTPTAIVAGRSHVDYADTVYAVGSDGNVYAWGS
jgi:hypothetical protein